MSWVIRGGLRLLMALYGAAMSVLKVVGRRQRSTSAAGLEILVTGTFHSDNWVMSHLQPLALAERCARVRMVSARRVPPMHKVEAVYPPVWLVRLFGPVPARLLTFLWTGLRTRPHIVGGFHLLVNALLAALLGRAIGSRSLYFCVGGPMEMLDGGLWSENRLFEKIETPDRVVERRLVQAVAGFDLVITMGSGAIRFFRQRGIRTAFHVVSGGIDARNFHPSPGPRRIDLILVGRLVRVKRVDLFLHALKRVQASLPGVTATVVGDGPLRASLQSLIRELELDRNVSLVGHQPDVQAWLRQAKVFVLTSDSEALALSLMEAMLCGLPAVVPDVGELSDLVEEGVNGYIVRERSPEAFADRLLELLTDPARLARFGEAARRSAMRYELGAVSRRWDDILAPPQVGATWPPPSESTIVSETLEAEQR